MNPNHVEVNIVALKELQDELIKLSKTIQGIADFMRRNMATLGNSWKDKKYLEFQNAFNDAIRICEKISQNYREWATVDLQKIIDNATAVKEVDVGASGHGSRRGSKALDDLLFAKQESDKAARNPYRSANEGSKAFIGSGEVNPKTRLEASILGKKIEKALEEPLEKIKKQQNEKIRQEMAENLKQMTNEKLEILKKETQNTNQKLNSSFNEFLSNKIDEIE